MTDRKSLDGKINDSTENVFPIPTQTSYFAALDGWRAIAIVCVLLAHWFPLGPASIKINSLSGVTGMSIFFSLSGFLITNLLIKDDNVRSFLIRRLFRILPLAYLYLVLVLSLMAAPKTAYLPNFLFYANWPPFFLDYKNSHFWSLSVEIEFYIAIALIVFFLKKRGLLLIPVLGVFITGFRILHGKEVSIETYYRVDEILFGACLALIYNNKSNPFAIHIQNFLKRTNSYIFIALLIASAHEWGGPLNYARPYFAAVLIGTTLYQHHTKLFSILAHPTLKYIATISFALYVIHPMAAYGWLDPNNTDSVMFKYLVQRPISVIIVFSLAHFSTFYYEKYWISLGKKLSKTKKAPNFISN